MGLEKSSVIGPGPIDGNAKGASRAAAGDAFRVLAGEVRGLVDAALVSLLNAKVAAARGHGEEVRAVAAVVADMTMRGGKRLRPALLAAGYRACGGVGSLARGPVVAAGAALELLQTYLLIHDDWMDRDETRRGGPSAHTMLVKQFGSTEKGEAAAILAGDYASALALEALADAPCAPARLVTAIKMFAAVQQDAVYGQQLDLCGGADDVEKMHDLKTGSYTVRGPLRLGAQFADASEAQRAALDAYAAPLGVAFQLRDDLLGSFGSEAETGKPAGNDVRAGKRTSLIAESERRLSPAGRDRLGRAFGVPSATRDEVERAVNELDACGARAAVEARLAGLADDARRALQGAPLTVEGVELLFDAATSLTARRT